MALHWIFDSQRLLVVHTAEGDFTHADLMAYIDAVEGAKVLSWRKLFDASTARLAMTETELMSAGARIRGTHENAPSGPMAVILPHDDDGPFMRFLGFLSAAERPMRLFRDLEPALRWVEAMPLLVPEERPV